MRNTVVTAATFLTLFALAACSSGKPAQPAVEKQQQQQAAPKPADVTSGREAFQKLYVAARAWAPDIKPFRLQSGPTSEANGQDGKSAIWRASFASASRRGIKTYVWSGTDVGGGSRGMTPGTEDDYNPENRATQVFDLAFLKTDSDKAVSVAQQHGGDKITKKDPAQPISYLLEWNPGENKLIWHVIYGTSRADSKLAVSVDATTGAFLRVEK